MQKPLKRDIIYGWLKVSRQGNKSVLNWKELHAFKWGQTMFNVLKQINQSL